MKSNICQLKANFLHQSFVFHTRVTIAGYDDVVMDGDVEWLGGANDQLGHIYVGL